MKKNNPSICCHRHHHRSRLRGRRRCRRNEFFLLFHFILNASKRNNYAFSWCTRSDFVVVVVGWLVSVLFDQFRDEILRANIHPLKLCPAHLNAN